MSFRTFNAYLDDQRLITLQLDLSFDAENLNFTAENEHQILPLTIEKSETLSNSRLYTLTAKQDIDLEQHYLIYDQDRNKAVLAFRHIIQQPIFDQIFDYEKMI